MADPTAVNPRFQPRSRPARGGRRDDHVRGGEARRGTCHRGAARRFPLLRLGSSLFADLDATAEGVRSSTYGGTESVVVLSAINAAETFRAQVSNYEPPVGSKRAGTHEEMVAAAQRVVDAGRTLLSADGPGREASLSRYAQVRVEAGESWNRALTALYRDTDVPPPLVG